MMENEEFSVIVRCWLEPQTSVTLLRMVSVETGEEVLLADTSFLLRISMHGKVPRCYIRHIASGNEAYVQGSAKLGALLWHCILAASSKESSIQRPSSSRTSTGTKSSDPDKMKMDIPD